MSLRTAIIPLLAIAAAAAFADIPATQPARTFDAYRMVRTRNIFDPQRLPMPTGTPPPVQVAAPPPKANDYVVLTGVMVTPGKSLAFFSGSQPDYDKVLAVSGTIAGATLTKITPLSIEVNRAGKSVAVSIGQTVPFDDSAPRSAADLIPTTASQSPDAGAPAPGSPPSPSSSNLSDVMRRMMERRQQQLK
jgi:hypothetical protein